MPLSAEQKVHIEESWKAADVRWSDEKDGDQRVRLAEARRTNNSGAVLPAYENAALDATRKRVESCVRVALAEIDVIGATIDRSVELFIMERVHLLTSTVVPLHFPPGLLVTHVGSIPVIQASYVRARKRLGEELDRESENKIRRARLRFESRRLSPREEQSITISHTYNLNGPNSRVNQNSTDNSVNVVETELSAALDELTRISAGHSDAEFFAWEMKNAYPDKPSMATKLKQWAGAAVTVEGLLEKAYHVLPAIQTWLNAS